VILVAALVGPFMVSDAKGSEEMVEYIVKTSGSVSRIQGLPGQRLRFVAPGASIASTTPEYIVVKIQKSSEAEWVSGMSKVAGVESVEPNYPVQISDSPSALNDPLVSNQAHLFPPTIMAALQVVPIRVVKVAVVDTGVDHTHPDLASQMAVNSAETINSSDDDRNGFIDDRYGYSFYGYSAGRGGSDTRDVHGHGTHVAGVIAAAANNGVFGVGINPSARIIPVPFMDSTGRGTQFDGAAAIKYAVDMGAEIINCSWGYYIYSGVLADAVEYAKSRGVLVVAAAGNDGSTITQFPASFSSAISVGSCGINGTRSSFSNRNSEVDVLAYGDSILSTLPSGQYGRMTGTSQATGVVVGVLSRLLSAMPTRSMTVEQITGMARLQTNEPSVIDARQYIAAFTITTADVAVAMATPIEPSVPPVQILSTVSTTLSKVMNFPNPVRTASTKFGFSASTAGRTKIRIFDLGGRCVKTIESPTSQGDNVVSWDLMGDNGQLSGNGTYLYNVELTSDSGMAKSRGKLTVLR